MCGVYQSWIEDEEMTAIAEREKKGNTERYLRVKEVFPGQRTLVLYGGNYFLRMREMIWGYPMPDDTGTASIILGIDGSYVDTREGYKGKKGNLILHARAETVMEKRLFREDAAKRRIVIPTSGYMEWSPEKQKYQIGQEPVYLAGIYHAFGEQERFVILTTRPTPQLARIHDRMPLVLSREEMESWLYDDLFSREKLKRGNIKELCAYAV